MTTPNRELLEAYGTWDVLAEKLAGKGAIAARIGMGILNASIGHQQQMEARQNEAQDEYEFHRQSAEEHQRIRPALEGFSRRSPIHISPGHGEASSGMLSSEQVPVGMDEGMVRLAAVAELVGREMAKEGWNMAAITQGAKMVADGAKQLGKNVVAHPGGIKGQLAMGAAAVGLGAVGSKAIKGTSRVMSQEHGPASYGPGRSQANSLSFGTNQYGYAQPGTPL